MPEWLAGALDNRGKLASLTGAWEQARHDLERALALCGQGGESLVALRAAATLGQHLVWEGKWEAAAAYLEQCLWWAERCDDRWMLTMAYAAQAELEIYIGQAETARTRLVAWLDRLTWDDPYGVLWILPVLAWSHLELDEVAQAAEVVARGEHKARAAHNLEVLVHLLRVQAMVALRRNDPAAAERVLEEGLTLARAMPYPYAEVRLLQVYAHLRAQQGEVRMARECREAAQVILQDLRGPLVRPSVH